MHKSIDNLALINDQIKKKFGLKSNLNIIAISKTFPMKEIEHLINHGHVHFGENKVQEAVNKWTDIKNSLEHVQLHMVGKLQTNKTKYVIPLFDYLHSLDNIKLAEKISIEQKKVNKKIKIFIQVNIGNEVQKSGINIKDLQSFYETCVNNFDLNIIGLMCLPPDKEDAKPFFEKMRELNNLLGLKELSMGMSSDYLDAIEYGSTYVRIGSKIFGKRI